MTRLTQIPVFRWHISSPRFGAMCPEGGDRVTRSGVGGCAPRGDQTARPDGETVRERRKERSDRVEHRHQAKQHYSSNNYTKAVEQKMDRLLQRF